MKHQHRATPEQWQAIKANGHLPTRSTILELLHRIEALEATQHAHIDLSHLSDAEREKMLKSIANPGRLEALEAAQQAHADASHVIDPEREKAARELMQAAGFAPPQSEVELRAVNAKAWEDAKPADSPPKPNYLENPGGSLVDRVADSMDGGTEWQARAAIREIAAWLREQGSYGHGWAAITLEKEVER